MRRERMPKEGMLMQIDGSFHGWLEGRGPWLTLLLAVDDATGKVPYAIFREREDAYGYFLLLEGIVKQHGIPLAVYHDRHAVLGQPSSASEIPPAKQKETQVGRALEELGVQQIFAKSPEAKGRVERAAGTFQDRLVSELRLACASNLADANRTLWEFLPRFNERFGVLPLETKPAYRALPPEMDLDGILCYKHTRKVARDNTVKYRWRTLQLLPEPGEPSRAGAIVQVQEHIDGSLVLCHKGRAIPAQESPPRPGVLRAQAVTASKNVSTTSGTGDWALSEVSATADTSVPDTISQDYYSRQPARQGPRRHGPTPRQMARWDAIRAAKEQGLSLRAIARDLGISRNTVRKYVYRDGPPTRRAANSALLETVPPTDRIAYQLT
jgi:lambda repressor-like predicted transcriptional regulator